MSDKGERAVRQRPRRSRHESSPPQRGTGPATWPHRSPPPAGSASSLRGIGVVPTSRRRVATGLGSAAGDAGRTAWRGRPRASHSQPPRLRPEARPPSLEIPRHQMIPLDPDSNPALPDRRRRPAPAPGKLRCPRRVRVPPTEPARRPPPAATTHGNRRSIPFSALGTVSTPVGNSSPPLHVSAPRHHLRHIREKRANPGARCRPWREPTADSRPGHRVGHLNLSYASCYVRNDTYAVASIETQDAIGRAGR